MTVCQLKTCIYRTCQSISGDSSFIHMFFQMYFYMSVIIKSIKSIFH